MGALFGSNSGSTPERYAGIQVSTSLMGQVLPLVYGRNRVAQNLVWYGNFQATPGSSGGKGGGSPSSWTYSAAWIGFLGIGPIQGVVTVYHDKSITNLSNENLSLFLGRTGQRPGPDIQPAHRRAQKIPTATAPTSRRRIIFSAAPPTCPISPMRLKGCFPASRMAAACSMRTRPRWSATI